MLNRVLKSFTTVMRGKAASAATYPSDAESGWNASEMADLRARARHARRRVSVKNAEFNQLRVLRKLELEARNAQDDAAHWTASTTPIPLTPRDAMFRKIDEAESEDNLSRAEKENPKWWRAPESSFVSTLAEEMPPPPVTLHDVATTLIGEGHAAAEAVLRAIVRGGPMNTEKQQGWASLLGLLRAANDRMAFESASLDYALIAGHPCAMSFDLPQVDPAASTAAPGPGVWVCPPRAGSAAMKNLRDRMDSGRTLILNWSRCTAIELKAARPLRDLLQDTADNGMAHIQDGPALLAVLRRRTRHPGPDTVWWDCLLLALRCLEQHEEYDAAALEFCKRFELSPPAWSPPAAWKKETGTQTLVTQYVKLEGEITELSTEAFEQMAETQAGKAQHIVFICQRLVRVDFYTAVAFVNWVASRTASGQHISTAGMHRLLETYFESIGLYDHATRLASGGPSAQGIEN